MYDIVIFGGGLSGLTIAHELIKKQFKVLIVEKDIFLYFWPDNLQKTVSFKNDIYNTGVMLFLL